VETLDVLKTQRLVLRPFHPNDVDAVFAYNSTAEWSPYLRSAAESYTRKNAEDFVSRAILQDKNMFSQFAITKGRKVIAGIGLKIDPQNKTAELKFSIAEEHRASGIATEAARAVVEHGFDSLGLFKIHTRADGGNSGMVQIFVELGMNQESLLRSHRVHGEERIDEVVYSVLRSEWIENAKAEQSAPFIG